MNRFYRNGADDFILVVNHKRNMIKAYFVRVKDLSDQYIDEDQPLGTGGGLSLLKGLINSTFILSNCDILERKGTKNSQPPQKADNLITMVCSLKHNNTVWCS